MFKRISAFLEQNNVFYEYQFGFKRSHSTTQVVMEVLANIYQYCDKHNINTWIYIDLQKPFDTVDRRPYNTSQKNSVYMG